MGKEMALPFVPFPGLQLVLDEEEQGEKVAEVIWLAKGGRFLVVVQPWDDRSFDFQVQVASLKGRGWRVTEGSLQERK
jgi:hypothetical protein